MAVVPEDLEGLTSLPNKFKEGFGLEEAMEQEAQPDVQDLMAQAAEVLGATVPQTAGNVEGGILVGIDPTAEGPPDEGVITHVSPTAMRNIELDRAYDLVGGPLTGADTPAPPAQNRIPCQGEPPVTMAEIEAAMDDPEQGNEQRCPCPSCQVNRGEISETRANVIRAGISERLFEVGGRTPDTPPTERHADVPSLNVMYNAARAERAAIEAMHRATTGRVFNAALASEVIDRIAANPPDIIANGRIAVTDGFDQIPVATLGGDALPTSEPEIETRTFGEEIYKQWGDIMTLIVDTLMVAKHIPSLGLGSLSETDERDITREELEAWVNDSLLMLLNENGSIYRENLLDKMNPGEHQPDPDYDLVSVRRHIDDLDETLQSLDGTVDAINETVGDYVSAVQQLYNMEEPSMYPVSQLMEDALGVFNALNERVNTLDQRGEQDAGAEPAGDTETDGGGGREDLGEGEGPNSPAGPA